MAGIITIQVKPPLRDIRGRFVSWADEGARRSARSVLQDLGKQLRDEMRREVPGSGRLARYISYGTSEDARLGKAGMRLTINLKSPGKPYPRALWRYILEGTRAHEIVPRRAGVLAFFWARLGRMAFFKRVWHPGTKANDFPARVISGYGGIRALEAAARRMARDAVAHLMGGRHV